MVQGVNVIALLEANGAQKAAVNNFMPHLDSLRAFACLLVIIQHWYHEIPVIDFLAKFQLGKMGVLIFFVLSGFLITRNLLNDKCEYERGEKTRRKILADFYVRRTLRIFPIYYISLLLFYCLNFNNIREKIGWYFFYCSNVLCYLDQKWDGPTGPFWSLAVEEQFYVVWPLLVLLCPKKSLLRTFIIVLCAGPISRVISYAVAAMFLPKSDIGLNMVLMPGCLDSFAIGGILAYAKLNDCEKAKGFFRNGNICMCLFGLSLIFFAWEKTVFYLVFFPLFFSIASSQLVCICSELNADKRYQLLIFNESTRSLGRISYGMYLYHTCIWWVYWTAHNMLKKYFPNLSLLTSYFHDDKYMWATTQFFILLLISYTSWFMIERPVNSFKKYFV